MAVGAGVVLLCVMCAYYTRNVSNKAADPASITLQRIRLLSSHCDAFYTSTGRWPVEMRELRSVMAPTNASLFLDGWGRHIHFYCWTGPPPNIWLTSYGADGKPGGYGADADMEFSISDLRDLAGRPEPRDGRK